MSTPEGPVVKYRQSIYRSGQLARSEVKALTREELLTQATYMNLTGPATTPEYLLLKMVNAWNISGNSNVGNLLYIHTVVPIETAVRVELSAIKIKGVDQ